MEIYVRQKIETTMAGERCSPYCYFYSENGGNPVCWLGRGHTRLKDGMRSAYCLSVEEKREAK